MLLNQEKRKSHMKKNHNFTNKNIQFSKTKQNTLMRLLYILSDKCSKGTIVNQTLSNETE